MIKSSHTGKGRILWTSSDSYISGDTVTSVDMRFNFLVDFLVFDQLSSNGHDQTHCGQLVVSGHLLMD